MCDCARYATVLVVDLQSSHTRADKAGGLQVSFGRHSVVSKGDVQPRWRLTTSNVFDIGYDPRVKE